MWEANEGKRLTRVEEMLEVLMKNDRKAFLPYFSHDLGIQLGGATP